MYIKSNISAEFEKLFWWLFVFWVYFYTLFLSRPLILINLGSFLEHISTHLISNQTSHLSSYITSHWTFHLNIHHCSKCHQISLDHILPNALTHRFTKNQWNIPRGFHIHTGLLCLTYLCPWIFQNCISASFTRNQFIYSQAPPFVLFMTTGGF